MRKIDEGLVVEILEQLTQKPLNDKLSEDIRRDPDFQRIVNSYRRTGRSHLEQIGREVLSHGVLLLSDFADRLEDWAKDKHAGVKEAEPLIAAIEERQRTIDATNPDVETRRPVVVRPAPSGRHAGRPRDYPEPPKEWP
jgi:hypothetical protein